MSTLHIVLVCHTELDFSGSWRLYEHVQPEIDALISRVEGASGKKPKITYCLIGEFLSERLDDAFRFLEKGHEIGIHTHLPGSHRPRHRYDGRYTYRLDEKGILNQDAVAGPLRQIAISLGLPAPRTHVSGMFTFQQTTIKCLADAGFSVRRSEDAGLLSRITQHEYFIPGLVIGAGVLFWSSQKDKQ